MAYKTNSAALALEDMDRRSVALRTYCQSRSATMAAGSVAFSYVVDIYVTCKGFRDAFDVLKAAPGILVYAQTVKNDGLYDVVSEANALIALVDAVLSRIIGDLPTANQAGTDYLVVQTLEAGDLSPQDRQFTVGQTANLRTDLDAVVAAILL